ncbi:MAG: hypothetical protein MK137_07005, partial [Rickettsiales bacterium]|nr:hypothetical protein [Rickettsiales bacterium]
MYRFLALILFSAILAVVQNSSCLALDADVQSEAPSSEVIKAESDATEQENKPSVRSPSVSGSKIVSFHISPIQVDTVGYDKEAFPKSLWQGSKRGQIEYLIESTSPDASSDVVKQLSTSLLLAKSSSLPEGEGKYSNLIDLRLKKLSEVGASEQAIELAGLIPQSLKNDVVKQIEVYNRIKLKQYDMACPVVKENLGRTVTSWNGFLLICQLGQQDYNVAGLTFALLRDAEFFDNPDILKKIERYIESAPSSDKSIDKELFEKLIQVVYINSDMSDGKYSKSHKALLKKDWSDVVQKRMDQVSRNTEIENELLLEKLQDYKKSNPNDMVT